MENEKIVDKILDECLNKNDQQDRPQSSISDASDGSFHSISDNLEAMNLNYKSNFGDSEASTDTAEEETEFFYPSAEKSSEIVDDSEKETNPVADVSPSDPFDDKEDTDEESMVEDEYFIDEEKLKDLELNLSDEDKIIKQKDALLEKEKGNEAYKAGRNLEAAFNYTSGLRQCPISCTKDRAILYANRAAARAKLDQKKPAIQDCTKAIELDDHYLRAIMRRAKLYEDNDSLDEALNDYKRIMEIDTSNSEARSAVYRLPPLIEERNEKMKTEMLGKLKDLGNVFLRPFGLSTNNFQLNQDPNSGGYNVQFNQNNS